MHVCVCVCVCVCARFQLFFQLSPNILTPAFLTKVVRLLRKSPKNTCFRDAVGVSLCPRQQSAASRLRRRDDNDDDDDDDEESEEEEDDEDVTDDEN